MPAGGLGRLPVLSGPLVRKEAGAVPLPAGRSVPVTTLWKRTPAIMREVWGRGTSGVALPGGRRVVSANATVNLGKC